MRITLPKDCAYKENMEKFLKELHHEVDYSDLPTILVEGFNVKENVAAMVVLMYLWSKFHGLPLVSTTPEEYNAACETLHIMADDGYFDDKRSE